MERRFVLMAIATGVAGSAFAQTNTTAPGGASAMKAATPSDAMATHAKRTMTVGALSLALSRIAEPRVKEAALKQFVGFEIAEQETIADILKAMATPEAKPSGMVPAPSESAVMDSLDAKGKEQVAKLRDMKAGMEFDRAYVRAQIEGHHELLEIQETYLKTADNLDETNVAKLAKGMITEHLTLLGDIEKRIG
jgi:predicted outer membrane protein